MELSTASTSTIPDPAIAGRLHRLVLLTRPAVRYYCRGYLATAVVSRARDRKPAHVYITPDLQQSQWTPRGAFTLPDLFRDWVNTPAQVGEVTTG